MDIDLLKQVKNKALSIVEAFYPDYSLVFLFDNMTSHSVYELNMLQVQSMGKDSGGK